MPLWDRAFVGPDFFFCEYFVGLKFLIVGISWVQDFFSFVLRRSESFSHGYFAGPKFFLVCILWVQFFFPWIFRW